MSKNKMTGPPLKHGEISKRIIAKPKKTRSPNEWFDDLGKYRDEHVSEYNQKKAAFMEAAKEYNKMNLDTMRCHKVVLNRNYEESLNLQFLNKKEQVEEEECSPFCCCPNCEPSKTGRLLRKRSIRPMTSTEEPLYDVCLIEPWFKRYLTLNKFVWAARTVILQNRLLKVLNQLKTLKPKDIQNIEQTEVKKKCEDYHCHPVFEKFL